MASFEEDLFLTLTINQKIEVQRVMINLISAEIRLTEDHFWSEVALLVDAIRDTSGEMEDRLKAFQEGVLKVQADCQKKITERSVDCYRRAVIEVASGGGPLDGDIGDGTLH